MTFGPTFRAHVPLYMQRNGVHLRDELAPAETLCGMDIDPRDDLCIPVVSSVPKLIHLAQLGRACHRCASLCEGGTSKQHTAIGE